MLQLAHANTKTTLNFTDSVQDKSSMSWCYFSIVFRLGSLQTNLWPHAQHSRLNLSTQHLITIILIVTYKHSGNCWPGIYYSICPVSGLFTLTLSCPQGVCSDRASAIDTLAYAKTIFVLPDTEA